MSRDQQRLPDYLVHIIEAIERIDRYTEDMGELAFLGNQMAQDAVIRNFEIIGEASHNIETHYSEFAAAHPELPLAFAYQMRNAVAHGYFKVDLEIVWKTIHSELPRLHAQVQEALADLPRNNDNE
ncbi:MAG: HepT-like ribonuclease domain-containing protein [Gammaproteobacteria bacterium]